MSTVNARKVPSRTFLCCIPVRAGVVIISCIGLMGGALMAALAIIQMKRSAGSGGNKVALIIEIVVYILLAILSFFGLAGAISRKLAFIRLYFWMVLLHLLLSMGLGIFAIHNNFKNAPQYVSECASGSEDPSVLKSCQDGSNLFKGITIALFVFLWLLEIWACVIVSNYSKQLVEEQAKETETW